MWAETAPMGPMCSSGHTGGIRPSLVLVANNFHWEAIWWENKAQQTPSRHGYSIHFGSGLSLCHSYIPWSKWQDIRSCYMLLLIARRLKYCWGNTHAWPSVHQHRRYFPGSAVTTSLGDVQRIMWGPMWVKTCSGLVLKMWDLQLISGLQRRKIMCINLIFQDISGYVRSVQTGFTNKKSSILPPNFPYTNCNWFVECLSTLIINPAPRHRTIRTWRLSISAPVEVKTIFGRERLSLQPGRLESSCVVNPWTLWGWIWQRPLLKANTTVLHAGLPIGSSPHGFFFIPSISWKPNKKGEAHLPLIISPPIFLALRPFLDHLRGVLTSSGLQFYPFRMPAPSRSKGFPVQPPATHPASCHVHRHPPPCQAVSAELRHATRSFRATFPRCQHDFAGWRHGTWQNLSDFT